MPTLKHTGLSVPHTEYTVTSLKQHQTRDGVAFTATLRHNRKIIGTIENTGTGGPDMFYPSTSDGGAATAALLAFAKQCRRPFGEVDGTTDGDGPLLEYVLGDLVTEYETDRDLTRAAKLGRVLVRMMEDQEWGEGEGPMRMPTACTFTEISTELAADRDLLAANLLDLLTPPTELAWWQVWNADEQRWDDVTDRPAHLKEAA